MEHVNIKKVFTDKSPVLAKLIPNFIFNYLRKIVHEDFINVYFEELKDVHGLDFVQRIISDWNLEIEIINPDNIKSDKKYVYVANHPLGGLDGIILINTIASMNIELRFLVNDILMNIKNMRNFFIPINKHGSKSRELAHAIEEAYQSDMQILTFPSGMVSRKIKGKIQDLEWQKNFILKARKYKRDIIPVHISGENSRFFYNLAMVRSKIGVKANLEMLYLADEMYKFRDRSVQLTFGDPISIESIDQSKSPTSWASELRSHIYELEKNPNKGFRA